MSSFQPRHNVLDVTYHVSQYQAVISELREEISRLNSKLHSGNDCGGSSGNTEKTKVFKKELVEIFREQMNARRKLIDIDTKLLTLYMEFEKINNLIQEWEAERLKRTKGPAEIGRKKSSDKELTLDADSGREIGKSDYLLLLRPA